MNDRAVRVGEQLRADLMQLILRGRLRDPATKGVVVTGIQMSGDLQHARVYLRTLEEASERKQGRVLAGMDRAAGFLRRELGKSLQLRHTPELKFFWDDAIDRGIRVERILADLADDRTDEESE